MQDYIKIDDNENVLKGQNKNMTLEYDKYVIECEKQIDRITNYLDKLGEDDLSEIYDLTQALRFFCDFELNLLEKTQQ